MIFSSLGQNNFFFCKIAFEINFKNAVFVLWCFTVEEVGISFFQLAWLATPDSVDVHSLW